MAWHDLGWTPIGFSEIEPFPCAVLKHRFPNVKNYGDMTKFKEWDIEPGTVDALVGGTPCQSFSLAGLRGGLEDPRGNLMLTFGALADHLKSTWLIWENVPGVLSSNEGRDFGTFLGMLGLIGYGFAYRILDAQYFGVPQRRERVFVVGHLGDWRRAAAVLFDTESLQGHPAPRRESRKDVAPTLAARTKGGVGLGTDFDLEGGIQVVGAMSAAGGTENKHGHGWRQQDWENGYAIPVMSVLDARGNGKGNGNEVNTLTGDHASRPTDYTPLIFNARQDPVFGEVSQPVDTDGHSLGVLPFDTTQITSKLNRSSPKPGDPCHPLAAGTHAPAIAMAVNAKGGTGRLDGESETFVAHTLRREGYDASEDGTGRGTPLVDSPLNKQLASRYHLWSEDKNASSQERYACKILSELWDQVGEEAFAKWRSRILDPLQSEEVLQSDLHGSELRQSPGEIGPGVDDRALPCQKNLPAGGMFDLWKNGPDRRTSQGRELAEQLAREPSASLSVLSYQTASSKTGVRRLTPVETERLQGFQDDWTRIPWRGKLAEDCPDGPRYKAIGNSMAVPCMRWIGERIQRGESA